jgi:hypothetical protein
VCAATQAHTAARAAGARRLSAAAFSASLGGSSLPSLSLSRARARELHTTHQADAPAIVSTAPTKVPTGATRAREPARAI